jgi:hypothetical protein
MVGLVVMAGREGRQVEMPVRCDPRTGRWFFRATVKHADGEKDRLFGTPGVPGPYHDLPNTGSGAKDAEHRAIVNALNGHAIAATLAQKEEPAKLVPTIKEYAVKFLAEYAAENKISERTKKRQILDYSILPFFGELRLDELRPEHVKRYAAAEREGGRAAKTINNRLAVLSSLIKYAVANGIIERPRGIKFKSRVRSRARRSRRCRRTTSRRCSTPARTIGTAW